VGSPGGRVSAPGTRPPRRAARGASVMPADVLIASDDVGLLVAYREGEVHGFERLFLRHSDRIRALALRYLRDVAEADDVVQETFLRLLRIADSIDDGFNVSGWLHRVATNICLTRLRTTRRVQVVDSAAEPMQGAADLRRTGQPEAAFEIREAREMFNRVAARLPCQQRACLLLREIEGLSYRDIADRLAVSPGSVESLLFRARRRFREEYLRIEGEEPSRCSMTRHLLETAGRSRLGARSRRLVDTHLAECRACRQRAGLPDLPAAVPC
jgi:RNA polymerase sigma-70 factor, ECF subfamily